MKLLKGKMPKPKKGQVWRHKQDGLKLLITGSKGDDMFRSVNLYNRKIQHHILKKTLWIYYDLIGTELKHDD